MWESIPGDDLSAEEKAFFEAFLYAATAVQRGVDADLAYEQQKTLSEYTTLLRLSAAPGRRLRINELAAACSLSLSRMSRIVEKLETLALVRREPALNDRRGWNAVLTESGAEAVRRGAPTYAKSARRHVLDRLDSGQVAALTPLLRRLAGLPPR